MAKAIVYAKEKTYKYPSQFGSHQSMINKAKTEELGNDELVICTDEYGDYMTLKSRLDDGLVDWRRADGTRVKVEKEGGKATRK